MKKVKDKADLELTPVQLFVIIICVCLLVFLVLPQTQTEQTNFSLESLDSWLDRDFIFTLASVVAVVLLGAMSCLYWGLSKDVTDKLTGGFANRQDSEENNQNEINKNPFGEKPPKSPYVAPRQNSGLPKGLFDHLRNYFIVSLFMYMALIEYTAVSGWMGLAGKLAFLLVSVVLFILNFFHGIRATNVFFEDLVGDDGHKYWPAGCLREYLWVTGVAKWPVYLILPIFLFAGVAKALSMTNATEKNQAIIDILCEHTSTKENTYIKYCVGKKSKY